MKGAHEPWCVVQTVTTSLGTISSSLSAVPDLTTYIASLTPAVTAYNALGPTIFTDMQSQVASINSSITSVSSRSACSLSVSFTLFLSPSYTHALACSRHDGTMCHVTCK